MKSRELNGDSIKILLVAEYSIFRIGLRMLLEKEEQLKVVGELSKIAEVSAFIGKEQLDLILVDLPSNNNGNADLFSFPFQTVEKTPILILTGYNDVEMYQKCLTSGISGLVLKDTGAEVLYKAIEKVCKGEFWFDRAVMGQTIRRLVREKQFLFDNPQPNGQETLTERERQVVDLICKGLKNKDIADRLFITETTVRHHLTSIFEKLSLASRLELVIHAFKHNLVKLPTPGDALTGDKGAATDALP